MELRGRCKCGAILTFREGPEGFKRRCPECQSVVRLRPAPADGSMPSAGSSIDMKLGKSGSSIKHGSFPGKNLSAVGPDLDATEPFEAVAPHVEMEPWKAPAKSGRPAPAAPGRLPVGIGIAVLVLIGLAALVVWLFKQ